MNVFTGETPDDGRCVRSVRVIISRDEMKDFIVKLRKNGGYCPCKVDKTDDTKCKCLEFRLAGRCECGVYESR